MKNKRIQVFTHGESEYCEINGELMIIRYFDNYVYIKEKEDNSVTEHVFPWHNIKQIRIF